MGILRQVAEYFYLRKKDPGSPRNFNIKAMHFINRLSILLFIVAMIILAVKLLRS
jgi:cob(I)alamin adenosyltransferase